jgi:hypothetical protein
MEDGGWMEEGGRRKGQKGSERRRGTSSMWKVLSVEQYVEIEKEQREEIGEYFKNVTYCQ